MGLIFLGIKLRKPAFMSQMNQWVTELVLELPNVTIIES